MALDVSDTVLSQYADSPTLRLLIQAMSEYFDPAINLEAFYDRIWNIDTAQGYGLDLWGRILGVRRVLQVTSGSYFGLTGITGASNASGDSFGGKAANSGHQPFYSGGPVTSNYALTDSAYRVLLLAKAAANISDGSVPSINAILQTLFVSSVEGRIGNAYCTDGGNMTMTYTFAINPSLTSVEFSIISQSGVLPRSAGVLATVVQL